MFILTFFVSALLIDGFKGIVVTNSKANNVFYNEIIDLEEGLEGQNVAIGEFPHQVALYPQLLDEFISFCGGSILSENWILTAAHCCDKAHQYGLDINVVAGGVSLQTNEGVEQQTSVADIHIPEDYGKAGTNNDICML